MAKPATGTQVGGTPEPDLGRKAVAEIGASLKALLADVFALYVKTKNFHWHMSGRHFRDDHLLLDEHADQVFAAPGSWRRSSRAC